MKILQISCIDNLKSNGVVTALTSYLKYENKYAEVAIYNLRSEIIPVISLHKRFRIEQLKVEDDEEQGGFIILNMDGIKTGIIIDRIARVVQVKSEEVKPPPQMLSGIGSEYIHGVIRQENGYLIVLDIRKLFDPKEMQKLVGSDR